jgi:hypothetical protein
LASNLAVVLADMGDHVQARRLPPTARIAANARASTLIGRRDGAGVAAKLSHAMPDSDLSVAVDGQSRTHRAAWAMHSQSRSRQIRRHSLTASHRLTSDDRLS